MNSSTRTTPEALRSQLADKLSSEGTVRTARIDQAFRVVPRHVFLPGHSVEDAYADHVVIIKRNEHGNALVSASQPTIIAMMLEQLRPSPGDRVLEIGAGTGYHAALLRELVSPDGQVTTIDIDPEAADQARAHLTAAGYRDVHVLTGDGAYGETARAPYDRIIVTAGAWDLPPAWWQQLTDHGRIVVPLRWRGLTRTTALEPHGGALTSLSMTMCGFIPMQGGDGEHALALHEDVTIYYDEDQPIDDRLRGVLDQPRHESWSGVTVGGNEPFDGVWLRLSTAEPGTCRIVMQPTAIASGRATPAIPKLNPALAERHSLAYFTFRRLPDTNGMSELGAIGHGPDGQLLSDRITKHIHTWNRQRTATPTLTAFPAGTLDHQLPAGAPVINKRHIRLAFIW
jgi:protein-L-isoaspartate(D-aspartate) O-methyltransferase